MSGLMLFLFIFQIVVAVLLIVAILLQSSDEDALSGIGAGAAQSGILSHGASVDLITKITITLGILLMVNSMALTILSAKKYNSPRSAIKDYIDETTVPEINAETQKLINSLPAGAGEK